MSLYNINDIVVLSNYYKETCDIHTIKMHSALVSVHVVSMPYTMQLCCIQLLYATKLHCVWWEVFCCMLHETCCLELDQWSNQATLFHATKLHRVWHAVATQHV